MNTTHGNTAVELRCNNTGGNLGICDQGGEAVESTTADVWTQSGQNVAQIKNNDRNGPGLHVNTDCAGSTVTSHPSALFDTRVWVDVRASQNLTSGDAIYERDFAGIHDQNCPTVDSGQYGTQNDAWFFALDQYVMEAGQPGEQMSIPLLTLVHTDSDTGARSHRGALDCHLEQEYHTREMGKVRHEAYYNQDCGDDPQKDKMHQQLVNNPGDCRPLALEDPNGKLTGTWVEYNCAAFVRSAAPIHNNGDSPQKARQILMASNLTSALFDQTFTDAPNITLPIPQTVHYNVNTSVTLQGTYPSNAWFSPNIKVITDTRGWVNTTVTNGNSVQFPITWANGVSTPNL